ncbi:MAG: SpaA isopeptide-forming pilin-related protein [Bacilli bacterium]|nr:SpaA isopeptide-forming pilin-related protein [Bacilli bacterium]
MKVKRLFKYAMSCMLFLMAIFTVTEVHAEQYTGQAIWPSEYISNIYIKKARPDGYTKYQQARFIRRSEDNAFVYCVQPYTDIDNNLPYYNVERSDYARVLGFSDAQWERISLLAYYGYGYEGHSDQKWYAITQVMIWRTTNPESDIYFTDTLNGNRVSRFDGEMAELESLVANHYKAPRFQDNIVMPIGSTITLNDSNNVLSNFRVAGATNVNASVNGNTLTVTATKVGDATINLQKSATKYELPPIVYFKDGSQNVFRVGNYDPVRTNLKIKVVGGKVTPEKYDVETKTKQAQGEATLDGAIYGIYKIDGTKIGTVSSNTTSNYLPELGRFYLLEEKASTGYTLDSNKYYFEITEDNLTPTVKVYEQVIRRDFEITKVYATDETTIMTPEVGVKFGVYNRNGVLVGEYTTNNQGNFEFNLPYGSYTVKQLTSTSGHEKMKDFNIEVKEVGGVIKKVISNAEITAKLRVVKIDAETKEVIKRAGIKFKILDTKTNEYVCQTTSYPKQKICVFETDENGEFITAYPLNTGTYKLEEVDQVIDGYLWNRESHEFTIDENSVLREDSEYGIIFDTQFENAPVKGEVKIEKVGEVAILDEGKGYKYINEKLAGIKFGIYQGDDEIATGITDENGNLTFSNLKLGSYCVKELKTLNGYILNDKPVCFTLKYKDQYTPVITYKTLIENKLKTTQYEFTKTDYSTDETLPNTKMEIYTVDNELVFAGETDANGKIVIERLPIGKYYILEKEAPEGYLINDEKMYFEVTGEDKVIKSTMKDEKITGTLEFTKTDFSESVTLPNTTIEIYNDKDELVYTGTTDENGKIVIEKIPYGKYYILEKEAPKGYTLNTEKMPFEIKEDGEIVKCSMKDEKIIEVPNTEKNEFPTAEVGSILLCLLGIGVFIYGKFRNKK